MPAIFRVTNPLGEVYYMDPEGCEITKGEAIVQAFRGHPATYAEEMARRKKAWSIRHDCREDHESNPHGIEEF